MSKPENLPAGLSPKDIPCRSCPQRDWECYPAESFAFPKRIDGSQSDPWPVCAEHEMFAMAAGWFPIVRVSTPEGKMIADAMLTARQKDTP